VELYRAKWSFIININTTQHPYSHNFHL
jgi:hypothetical protein